MRRGRREIQDLLARLGSEVSPPSEHDLRAMARTASSRSRPLPPPVPSRRWPLQARWTGVLALALVVAIGVGVGLGALIAPSGAAAPGPIGTGFLAGPGWTVLQTGSDATPERQALAVAANVPLHPEDSARGIRNSSGLPYSTLLQLPPRGVVIVALFTRRESEPWAAEDFPRRDLPLRVREAIDSISYSYQMRPERPLGQYELRATVGNHYIVLHFYFGNRNPSPEIIAAAQRQLDRLVVASDSAGDADNARRPSASVAAFPTASKIVDRTVECETGDHPIREVDVTVRSGVRERGDRTKWQYRPSASFVAEGSWKPATPNRGRAGISAGWPPVKYAGFPLNPVALYISTRCKLSRSRVSLSRAGLSGSVASQFEDEYDCVVPARVLVRVRAIFRTPTKLRRDRWNRSEVNDVADGPVREGTLAISTFSGKPIALATVHESGRTRIFVADTCGPNG